MVEFTCTKEEAQLCADGLKIKSANIEGLIYKLSRMKGVKEKADAYVTNLQEEQAACDTLRHSITQQIKRLK